jgi:hypothetical protein
MAPLDKVAADTRAEAEAVIEWLLGLVPVDDGYPIDRYRLSLEHLRESYGDEWIVAHQKGLAQQLLEVMNLE